MPHLNVADQPHFGEWRFIRQWPIFLLIQTIVLWKTGAMAVSLRQIRGFLAVADAGAFTKAAARLKIAQPALSQLVRELERDLNIRLFDRTTRRVELTEGGREFQRAALKLMQDLDLAISGARNLASRKQGRITVAAPPFLAATILPRAIARLRSDYPGLQVIILDINTAAILDAVRSGKADYGFGTFPASEEDLDRIKLSRDSLMLFCPLDHRLARRKKIRWSDLAGEPLIALTRDSGIRLLVELGYEGAKIPLRLSHQVSQISTALALAGAGQGVTIMPSYVRPAAARHRLAHVQLFDPHVSRDIELVRARDRSHTPAGLAFADVLRASIRKGEAPAV